MDRVDVSGLPLFTNQRARCSKCGSGPPIRVHFDRGCATVVGGDHFHRVCRCGWTWAEQSSESVPASPPDDRAR